MALELIQSYPQLAIARDGNGETALHVLARKPSAFLNGSQLGIWQRCLYSCKQFSAFRLHLSVHIVFLTQVFQGALHILYCSTSSRKENEI